MNASASRVRSFLAALMMAAYLGQSTPAYAHGTDSQSSAGQHNYITADVYAQLDEPDNGDTFTGTTNVNFDSAAGHKLVGFVAIPRTRRKASGAWRYHGPWIGPPIPVPGDVWLLKEKVEEGAR